MSKSEPSENDTETALAECSFEDALKRLEELVRHLEQGNVPLEQSLAEYSEAVQLLRVCQGKLDAAQCRIELLSGFDANGQPVTRPLSGDGDMTLEQKREARSARRSADSSARASRAARKAPDVDESGNLF
ncbi:MAG: exodeoxyribonuclease VII small subunit [Aureliella sp.]